MLLTSPLICIVTLPFTDSKVALEALCKSKENRGKAHTKRLSNNETKIPIKYFLTYEEKLKCRQSKSKTDELEVSNGNFRHVISSVCWLLA